MFEADISKLYENLTLADEDSAVHEMAEEVKVDGVEDVEKCLVGKVLVGKKVNREAFKGLIEQIWSPFGSVEIKLVEDNIFMFYFNNCEDRNRVWHRGPWHFGNSLIVLEKPAGPGHHFSAGFQQGRVLDPNPRNPDLVYEPENGKMASGTNWRSSGNPRGIKGMLGEVYEGQSQNRYLKAIETVAEAEIRLPEFCFACGKIGHDIKACVDENAKKAALDGSPNKFGSWLKAAIPDRTKSRGNVQGMGNSSDMTRSKEASRETEGDGFVSLRYGSMAS
ncbi:hypothetical protein EZV62_012302 [Acer yangbiense]|uniref:CCHC-type domain-containing protein n=1 Tax=Acer yangbiense TaxID=1000413 RepID=A0A5C7HW28_9ROSI|nr:hypothetical protein EZV62_012302 [Acer yangbiense]